MNRIARLTLLAYPPAFRRAFGSSYLQCVADLEAHSGRSRLRIAGRLLGEALTTAPTMRWKNRMSTSKLILTVIVTIAAAFGVLLGAPIIALPLLAVLGLLVIGARRHDRPIAVEAAAWRRRWSRWLGVAALLCVIGLAMLLTSEDSEDSELSSVAWAVWILSWLAAVITVAVGLGFGATRFVSQRRT